MTLNYDLGTLKLSEVDMELSGLHILLTYQCIYQCEHCFVWGGPSQKGVLAINQVEQILQQAREAGVTSIYFEGGEPFLFRGRAAVVLAPLTPLAMRHPWDEFTECPHEDLREPGRIHVDPLGNLHICQGVIIGNLFEKPLKEICECYDPDAHPICGLLLEGGPAALVSEYNLPHETSYADACHLCYQARLALRGRFPQYLAPDQMYGAFDARK